jgi:hypothetical protein
VLVLDYYTVLDSQSVSNRPTLFHARGIYSALKMEPTRFSETSVYNKPTLRHIPEDDIFQLTTVFSFVESF